MTENALHGEFPTFAVVVPTYKPGKLWRSWLEAFSQQTVLPVKTLIIDSNSSDGTVELAREYGLDVHVIPTDDFDHGGTRQSAVEMIPDVEVVVYLTQDAILATPRSIEKLVSVFSDPNIGAAYGRQLPSLDANAIAAHARLFNYPEQSRLKSCKDISELGIKTAFISNSFAAYRSIALRQVGGFPSGTLFAEDQIVGSRLVLNGWVLAYVAEARVLHSHNYTLQEEFKRYFDIGVFHKRESWLIEAFGRAEGEGKRFLVSEMKYLAANNSFYIPVACLRTVLKLLAYRLGAFEKNLPLGIKQRISLHRKFWLRKLPQIGR